MFPDLQSHGAHFESGFLGFCENPGSDQPLMTSDLMQASGILTSSVHLSVVSLLCPVLVQSCSVKRVDQSAAVLQVVEAAAVPAAGEGVVPPTLISVSS